MMKNYTKDIKHIIKIADILGKKIYKQVIKPKYGHGTKK
jgi:hypothetical protein